jgi:transcriptional regulator with XRE-family HTH domain
MMDSAIDHTRLLMLLSEKNWKAPELAHYAGINYHTAYAIVKGRRANPNANTLTAICKALGCTSDYLLGKSKNRYPATNELPELVRQLARVASRLSEARQEELIRLAALLEDLEREKPSYNIPAENVMRLVQIVEKLGTQEDKEDMYAVVNRDLDGTSANFLGLSSGHDNGKPFQN